MGFTSLFAYPPQPRSKIYILAPCGISQQQENTDLTCGGTHISGSKLVANVGERLPLLHSTPGEHTPCLELVAYPVDSTPISVYLHTLHWANPFFGRRNSNAVHFECGAIPQGPQVDNPQSTVHNPQSTIHKPFRCFFQAKAHEQPPP